MAKKSFSVEFVVGIFIVIGFLAIAYMTFNLGGVITPGNKFTRFYAQFNSVTGLKKGAQVEIAGVPVGKVSRIYLDQDEMAMVELLLDPQVKLQTDVIASVKTQGIIGDKYIKISPGGDDEYLKDGDTITETESAIDLEELVSKFVFGGVK